MAEGRYDPAKSHLAKKITTLTPDQTEVSITSYDDYWLRSQDWWLFNAPQTTPPWHAIRRGRISSSTIGSCLNHGQYARPEKECNYILGREQQFFSEKAQSHLERGIKGEPLTRSRYVKEKNCYVLEIGFCIPHWESRIGSSVDGIIIDYTTMAKICPQIEDVSEKDRPYFIPPTEQLISLIEAGSGLIEIKRPERMWHDLILRYKKGLAQCTAQQLKEDAHIWEHRFDGIFQNHFDQMMLSMAILRKPWCDFVVEDENARLYIERIPYCHNYFINRLLLPIRDYINIHIDPYLPLGWRVDVPL